MDKTNIRITITKVVPNPRYAEEMENREKNDRRGYGYNKFEETTPPREVTTDILITEITAEQFEKIRQEVLKVF